MPSQKERAAHAEDYKIKRELTDDGVFARCTRRCVPYISGLRCADKKKDLCVGCGGKFNLMRRRTFCQHCNEVYCTQASHRSHRVLVRELTGGAQCVTKTSELPEKVRRRQAWAC